MGDQVIQVVNIGLDTNTTDMSSSLDINMLRLLDTCKLPVSSFIVAVFYWWRKPENPEKTTDLS
jgi:hypothetical protein